jgi:uncharacterized protein YecT (DUF1311 family)
MIRLLLVLACCATTAQAQSGTAAVDAGQVAACFADTPRGVTAPQCLAAAAQACMQQPGGFSTIGMSACTEAETAIWDGYLNAHYKARMAQLTQDQRTALRDAQRAWIAFRDADCGLQYQMFIEGTLRSNVYTGCMLSYTAARAMFLRDLGAN